MNFEKQIPATLSATAFRQFDPIDCTNVLSLLDWRPVAGCFTLSVANVGPSKDKTALGRFTALGVNEVIQLSTPHRLDSLTKAKLLRDLVLSQSFSLVMLGAQSSDVGSAQVAPALAGLLNWSCITNVTSIRYISKSVVTLHCSVGNVITTVCVSLPCVLSCDLCRTERRLSPKPQLLPSRLKPINIIPVNETNLALSSQIEVIEETSVPNIRLGLTFSTLDSTLEAFSHWLGKRTR
ncbi:MAG: hypothetical protein ACTS47_02995 [Candidatus Hodgkinia cicadicola]